MLKQRNVTILSLSAILALVLFNFQNCAPAIDPQGQALSSDQIRIVDDWSKAEIQFAADSVQIHDEANSADVSGLCNRKHNGAALRWALWADDKEPLLVGDSVCKSGQFALKVDDLESMVCGVSHRLVVEGQWGGMANARLQKRCQPLASEPIHPPEQSPMGTVCAIEYVLSEGMNSSCTQVCYREQKVVFNVVVDAKRCSGLAQKLASPY